MKFTFLILALFSFRLSAQLILYPNLGIDFSSVEILTTTEYQSKQDKQQFSLVGGVMLAYDISDRIQISLGSIISEKTIIYKGYPDGTRGPRFLYLQNLFKISLVSSNWEYGIGPTLSKPIKSLEGGWVSPRWYFDNYNYFRSGMFFDISHYFNKLIIGVTYFHDFGRANQNIFTIQKNLNLKINYKLKIKLKKEKQLACPKF